MEIKIIEKKEVWENFLLNCKEKTFLQSWNWGEFQKMMGNKIWRLGVYAGDNLLGLALIIKISAKRGTFLFCPHGPVIENPKFEIRLITPQLPTVRTQQGAKRLVCNSKQIQNYKLEILNTLLERLKKIAKEEEASFIRMSPIWEGNKENIKIFKTLGFKEAPIHMHPEITWELDITSKEDVLLMQMRKTTRYLIRQAQKNLDVRIEKSPAIASAFAFDKSSADESAGKQILENVERFNGLYQATVDRHHFTPFSLDYLKNEVLAFAPDNQVVIFLGKYKEELLASAIIIFWQEIAFYHQGASSLKYPKIPVSYLLQWETIKEAEKRGCKIYNFWGIAPDENPKHPWAGLTLFKKGFGGYKKEYVKTQDLILSNKYWLNYFVEKIRRSKRGL